MYNDNNMRPADFAAMMGGLGNGGFGSFGGDWIVLLFLFMLFGGGWGGMGMMGGWGGMGMMGGMMFPWWLMNQNTDNNVNGRFDQLATQNAVSGVANAVNNGFSDVQLGIAGVNQNLCSGFAGVNQTVQNGFAQAEIAENSRQMATMQQNFGMQTAMGQGFNTLGSQLAQCCCDNRLATESLRATVLQENCQDRYEAANNTRDIIDNQNRNNQLILDKLCQLELDGVKQNYENRIAGLQNALDQARSDNQGLRFAASQGAQTATIQAGQRALANEVEQYVNPTPVPSYNVPNPYTGCCGNQGYYGCCGNAA